LDVYGTYNYSYWGESKPTNITGGPHIEYHWQNLVFGTWIWTQNRNLPNKQHTKTSAENPMLQTILYGIVMDSLSHLFLVSQRVWFVLDPSG